MTKHTYRISMLVDIHAEDKVSLEDALRELKRAPPFKESHTVGVDAKGRPISHYIKSHARLLSVVKSKKA